jgi:hypothetical protein
MARRTGAVAPRARPPPRLEWRARQRPLASAKATYGPLTLELDVAREHYRAGSHAVWAPLARLLGESEVETTIDLLGLVHGVLTALTPLGYRNVNHWEARPGGWLPLPEPTHASLDEPVAHLQRALQSGAWRVLAESHSFAVRLSGPRTGRLDVVVRRVHRERGHGITFEIWGAAPRPMLERTVRSVHEQIPLDRAEVVEAVAVTGGPRRRVPG